MRSEQTTNIVVVVCSVYECQDKHVETSKKVLILRACVRAGV